METITSRKNSRVQVLRALGRDKAYRREQGLFLCDGEKLLSEALANGADIAEIYLRGAKPAGNMPEVPVYSLSEDVFNYASPLEHSPGPLFTVRTKPLSESVRPDRVIVLENVQDPGNVGTVLRTLDAFDADGLFLLPGCADVYSPKTMRASMGAVFRRPVWTCTGQELHTLLRRSGIPLYGAALRADTMDARAVELSRAAVAIGSEGRGLTEELLALCDGTVRIPMSPRCESLNAAVAASVLLWEAYRGEEMDACQH